MLKTQVCKQRWINIIERRALIRSLPQGKNHYCRGNAEKKVVFSLKITDNELGMCEK